eukprot:TRINITY_DN9352_c0_g1_i1.p1 TRINITY_DN9352_c0_g1~~TRINITY_DN9352_c0_g1_i1.p1  ORF type:complete len:142 (-),score=12.42 TRINITY_DN9352_c0_g1_i1:20-445(-)
MILFIYYSFHLSSLSLKITQERVPPIMNWSEFLDIDKNLNSNDNEDPSVKISFLADIGAVVWMKGMKLEKYGRITKTKIRAEMSDVIFLDPRWTVARCVESFQAFREVASEGMVWLNDLPSESQSPFITPYSALILSLIHI